MNDEELAKFEKALEESLSEKEGLFVWAAYRIARERGEPIPGFVLKYMDRVAEQFFQLTRFPPDEYETAIAQTLNLKAEQGGDNPFKAEQRFWLENRLLTLWFERGDTTLAKDFDNTVASELKIEPESVAKLRQRLLRKMNHLYRFLREAERRDTK